MGRPPLPKTKRRSRIVKLRLSAAEYRKLAKLAAAEGLSVSAFLRRCAKGD